MRLGGELLVGSKFLAWWRTSCCGSVCEVAYRCCEDVMFILVIVKLATTVGEFNYVSNLVFSSCTKVAFLQNKVALPHTKFAYQKFLLKHMQMKSSFEHLITGFLKLKTDRNSD
jgi:hypothetical protein